MRAPSPAFSFYPKDILTDENVAAMTDEEFGVYVRLLCHAWLEGSIPADLGRIARMLRRPQRTIERLWPAIAACWEEADGRLTQRKLEAVRAQQVAFRDRQSEKGKRSAKSRTVNNGAQPRLNRGSVSVEPEVNLPFPSPITKEQRTTEAAAIAPRQVVKAMVKAEQWNAEAAEDFVAAYGGPPPGQFFRQVKPIALKYGWGAVRPVLRDYMAETALDVLAIPKVLEVRVVRAGKGETAITTQKARASAFPTRSERNEQAANEYLRDRKAREARQG